MRTYLDHEAPLPPDFLWAMCENCSRPSAHVDAVVYNYLTQEDEQYIPRDERSTPWEQSPGDEQRKR